MMCIYVIFLDIKRELIVALCWVDVTNDKTSQYFLTGSHPKIARMMRIHKDINKLTTLKIDADVVILNIDNEADLIIGDSYLI